MDRAIKTYFISLTTGQSHSRKICFGGFCLGFFLAGGEGGTGAGLVVVCLGFFSFANKFVLFANVPQPQVLHCNSPM